jgi:hypothetical protein
MPDTVKDLIIGALTTDGECHKQWYLEQIAAVIGIELVSELQYEKGMPP